SCFFFQAEDGIRDRNVTGVQTCALPICRVTVPSSMSLLHGMAWLNPDYASSVNPSSGTPSPHTQGATESHRAVEISEWLQGRKQIGRASCRERGEREVVEGCDEAKRRDG